MNKHEQDPARTKAQAMEAIKEGNYRKAADLFREIGDTENAYQFYIKAIDVLTN